MDKKRRGRVGQTLVYTGKMFRLFWKEGEWKNLLFAAIVAGTLIFTASKKSFVDKDATRVVAFCMVSTCIWIGIFNSIQSVCKERKIIKQEHRAGLHMSSYVMAHVIKQFVLCLLQSAIMFVLYNIFFNLPEVGLITGSFLVDFFITLFLLTFSAALLGLVVSSVVKTPTAAMTIMPFLLIVQLIFSGAIFSMSGEAMTGISNLTISRWGMRALCTDMNLNELSSNEVTNQLKRVAKYMPETEVLLEQNEDYILLKQVAPELAEKVLEFVPSPRMVISSIPKESLDQYTKLATFEKIYTYDKDMMLSYWKMLVLYIGLYIVISIAALEFIDFDKR